MIVDIYTQLEEGLNLLGDPIWIPSSQSSIGSQADVNNTDLLKACETYESGWPPTPDMDSDMENGNIGSPSMSRYLNEYQPDDYLNDPYSKVMPPVTESVVPVLNIDEAYESCSEPLSPESVMNPAECIQMENIENVNISQELDDLIERTIADAPPPSPEIMALLGSFSQELELFKTQPVETEEDLSNLVEVSRSDSGSDSDASQEADAVYFQPVELEVEDAKPAVSELSLEHVTKRAAPKRALKRKIEDSDEDYEESKPKNKSTKQAQNREAASRYRLNKKKEAEQIEAQLAKLTKHHSALLKEYNDIVNRRNMMMDIVDSMEQAGQVQVKWPEWRKK